MIGLPCSSMNRTQKSLRPGPLMTAPRMTLRPLLSVSRGETQSSITIRRSPERSTASLPLSHHMDAELEPTAMRTFFSSRGAVDDGDGPEDDAVGRLVQAVGEAEELDVETGGVEGVPRELLAGHRHRVAVARNHGHLPGEVLRGERTPDVAVGEHGVGAVRLGDGLEQQPAPQEALDVRRPGHARRRREVGRDRPRGIVRRRWPGSHPAVRSPGRRRLAWQLEARQVPRRTRRETHRQPGRRMRGCGPCGRGS